MKSAMPTLSVSLFCLSYSAYGLTHANAQYPVITLALSASQHSCTYTQIRHAAILILMKTTKKNSENFRKVVVDNMRIMLFPQGSCILHYCESYLYVAVYSDAATRIHLIFIKDHHRADRSYSRRHEGPIAWNPTSEARQKASI